VSKKSKDNKLKQSASDKIYIIRKNIQKIMFYIISFGMFFSLYEISRLLHWVDPSLLPSLTQVGHALINGMHNGSFYVDIYWSIRRVVIGFVTGIIMAVGVGFVMGYFKLIRYLFDPIMSFLRALPPIALIPLAVIIMGIGETSKISVLIYASFFPAVVIIYQGLTNLNPLYIRAAKCLGTDSQEMFIRIILPQMVPHFITACRVSLGVCWATLVAAEMIAARRGLGAMIINSMNFFQIPPVVLGIFLIGFISLLIDSLVRYIERKLTFWQEKIG